MKQEVNSVSHINLKNCPLSTNELEIWRQNAANCTDDVSSECVKNAGLHIIQGESLHKCGFSWKEVALAAALLEVECPAKCFRVGENVLIVTEFVNEIAQLDIALEQLAKGSLNTINIRRMLNKINIAFPITTALGIDSTLYEALLGKLSPSAKLVLKSQWG